MDDEFEHIEFIQQYGMFEMEMEENLFLHRGRFKTEQPKEDDIARCMCMKQLSLPVFLCGKGSKGFAVTAVFWVFALV